MSGSGIVISFLEASENSTPCRLKMRNKLEKLVATIVSASLPVEPVFREKYEATVVNKSLKEVEKVSVRARI